MLVVQFLKEAWHSTYLSLTALVALFFPFCLMILFPYVNVLADYLDVKYFSNPSRRRFIFCSLLLCLEYYQKRLLLFYMPPTFIHSICKYETQIN